MQPPHIVGRHPEKRQTAPAAFTGKQRGRPPADEGTFSAVVGLRNRDGLAQQDSGGGGDDEKAEDGRKKPPRLVDAAVHQFLLINAMNGNGSALAWFLRQRSRTVGRDGIGLKVYGMETA